VPDTVEVFTVSVAASQPNAIVSDNMNERETQSNQTAQVLEKYSLTLCHTQPHMRRSEPPMSCFQF
jgi:hypothetical protein